MKLGDGMSYEFGLFRMDVAEHTLLRDGHPVQLTPKVFDVLRVLVQHSGHLVEKETLLREVWPDCFIEEANLNRSISVLRKALGETAAGSTFIETVPKRGYRFTATVKVVGNHVDSMVKPEGPALSSVLIPELAPRNETVRISRRISGPVVVVVALFVVCAIAFIPVLVPRVWKKPASEVRLKQAEWKQLTSETLGAIKPVFSTKGNILHIANGAIHVRDVSGDGLLQITEEINPSGDMPVFTADGSHVVFSMPRSGAEGSRSYDLWMVPSIGGAPKLFIRGASGAGFSPDGKWVAYTKYLSSRTALWISSASDLNKNSEVASPGFVPRWSPDGKWLVYTSCDPNRETGSIWISSILFSDDGKLTLGQRKELTREKERIYGMTWTADSRSIIYAASRNGPWHLYRLSILDGSVTPVTTGMGDYSSPSISPDGKTLLCWHGMPVINLVTLDGLTSSKETHSTQDEYHLWPRLSPSANRVVSVMRRPDSDQHLYLTDLKTMKRLRLSDRSARHPCWIDEETVAYLEDTPSGDTEVRVANIAAGIRTSLTQFSGTAVWLAVDPTTKRRVAVAMKSPGGMQRIVLRDLDKQQDDRIVVQGGEYEQLRWSPDGSAISWSGTERSSNETNNGIWVFDLRKSVPYRLVADGYGPVWSRDSSIIFFSRIRDYSGLWCLDLEQKRERQVRSWSASSRHDFDLVGERLLLAYEAGRGQVYSMSLDQ